MSRTRREVGQPDGGNVAAGSLDKMGASSGVQGHLGQSVESQTT